MAAAPRAIRSTRRQFLRAGTAAAAGLLSGYGGSWASYTARAAPRRRRGAPYGPLKPPDANGVMLPPGFASRVIARAGHLVPHTSYRWPRYPDGSATFPTRDGGWILACNSEDDRPGRGGVSAIRFSRAGHVRSAYRILEHTVDNCSGGATPWRTWLSCEETPGGQVWECDPYGRSRPRRLPALGTFQHESVCVDPHGRRLYMTEDEPGGGIYRFTPARYPDLGQGRLEIATVLSDGRVHWNLIPDPTRVPLRDQVPHTGFVRPEGMFLSRRHVYFATTADDRVYVYDPRTEHIRVLYDGKASPRSPLHDPDNVVVSKHGDVFVCEDPDNLEVCIIRSRGQVSVFLRLDPARHAGSELTGPSFDPSGGRLYVSSQHPRGERGTLLEIAGPF